MNVIKAERAANDMICLLLDTGETLVCDEIVTIPAMGGQPEAATTKAAPVKEKPVKEKVEDRKEPAPEPEVEDPWTKDEISALNREGLEEVIEDEELGIDPEDFPSNRKLKAEVLKVLEEKGFLEID